MMLPSKFTTMPSSMESNEPSEPHMHVGRHDQVLESVSLICEAPAFANRRGVAGGADHDFGALVGAFARHLGEHAVMANDQRDFLRPSALRRRERRYRRAPRARPESTDGISDNRA